jgi:hypothetical protein
MCGAPPPPVVTIAYVMLASPGVAWAGGDELPHPDAKHGAAKTITPAAA